MAITKSYTFTNGTNIDPDEMNQNFDDLLDEIKGSHHRDADGTLIAPADIHADWGLVPKGGIIFWSGTIANIPSGYSFCNGSNGTIDMRDKFVICPGQDSGGTYDTADTGGSATVNIAHTHTGTTGTTGDHSHSITTATHLGHNPSGVGSGHLERGDWALEDHNHGGTTGNSGGNHSHSFTSASSLSASQSILPPYRATVFIQLTNL